MTVTYRTWQAATSLLACSTDPTGHGPIAGPTDVRPEVPLVPA